MFVRRDRGLFELCMAALCLWAAYHHTPVGALVRMAAAQFFGAKSSARPVLAYFSGGHRMDGGGRPLELPLVPAAAAVTKAEAAGYGLHAALAQLPPGARQHADALARAHGLTPSDLVDKKRGPEACATLLARAMKDLGSEEVAVLATFTGPEPARYAHERAVASGQARPDLEALARGLPPGFEDAVQSANDALALSVAYGLEWPVSRTAPVTSPFGYRRHPTLHVRKLHTGVDLGVPIGTRVKAVADGVVRRASYDGVNGNILVVDHGRGVTTAYCHNDALLVREGQAVKAGAVIARSGNTGRSTGPHLHYQVEVGGRPVVPLAFRALQLPVAAGGSE